MQDHYLTEPLLAENQTDMVVPKRKLSKLMKIGGAICVLAVVLVLVSVLATRGRVITLANNVIAGNGYRQFLAINGVKYQKISKSFTFIDHKLSKEFLNIQFSYELVNGDVKTAPNCHVHNLQSNPSSSCSQFINLELKNGLFADVYDMDLDGLPCHSVRWHTKNTTSEITNCFQLEDNWYGGGGLSIHRWPLNRVNVPLQPHLTQKLTTDRSGFTNEYARFDSFIEPYFVSAAGAAVLIDRYLPMFISINHDNSKQLCFTSAFREPYAVNAATKTLSLQYLVCKDRTAKSVHQHLLKTSKIPFYHKAPEIDILQKPIWSTRGLYSNDISEAKLLQLVNSIKSNKLPYGHLFIDGNYSRYSGNFYFNENKFPHSHQLIMELNSPREDKLPVGIEIFPYVPKEKSDLFAVQYKNKSTLKAGYNQKFFLDVTNEDALTWFRSELTDVASQISLKGFRFSGGFAMDLVDHVGQANLITNKTFPHLNMFTKKFAEVASEMKDITLLGSGYDSQSMTFIADAGPMTSSWSHDKGLQSVIPTTLTYGLMGYPFSLAGPIGGIHFGNAESSGQQMSPEKELFIRWLQLAAHLPVMELSTGPWIYDQEVVNYTQALLTFRYQELWPYYLSSAVAEAVKLGTPIARPLWWVAADDDIAQFIDCEFFLGDSLLVAPVLYANARHRDVYLPEGSWWKDQLRGDVRKGGQWLRKYPVGLYEIATFLRQTNPPTHS